MTQVRGQAETFVPVTGDLIVTDSNESSVWSNSIAAVYGAGSTVSSTELNAMRYGANTVMTGLPQISILPVAPVEPAGQASVSAAAQERFQFVGFESESGPERLPQITPVTGTGAIDPHFQAAGAARFNFNDVLVLQPPNGPITNNIEWLDTAVYNYLRTPGQDARANILSSIRDHYLDHDDRSALLRYQSLFTLDAIARLQQSRQGQGNQAQLQAALRDLALISNPSNPAANAASSALDGFGATSAEATQMVAAARANPGRPTNFREALLRYLASSPQQREQNLTGMFNASAFGANAQDAQTQVQLTRWASVINFARDIHSGTVTADGLVHGVDNLRRLAQGDGQSPDAALATQILAALGDPLLERIDALRANQALLPQQIAPENPGQAPDGNSVEAIRRDAARRLSTQLTAALSNNLPESFLQMVGRENPELVALAREHAREIRTENVRRSQEQIDTFLQRHDGQSVLPQEERTAIIDRLRGFDANLPNSPFGQNIQDFRVIDNIARIMQTDDPAVALTALNSLSQTQSMFRSPFLSAVSGYEGDMYQDLADADSSEQALQELQRIFRENQQHLDSALNQMRVERLTDDLQLAIRNNPLERPENETLESLRTSLEQEANAGNTHAQPWLEWTNVQILLGNLQEATTSEDARAIINQLAEQAEPGDAHNPGNFAFRAVVEIVGSGATEEQLQARVQLGHRYHGLSPQPVLPASLEGLSRFDRMEMRGLAGQALAGILRDYEGEADELPRALSGSEVMTLSTVLGQSPLDASPQLQQTVRALILWQLRTGDQARSEQAAEGLVDALQAGMPNIGDLYVAARGTTAFDRSITSVAAWARESFDPTALGILAELATGNPNRRDDRELAAWAANQLVGAAQAGGVIPAINAAMVAFNRAGVNGNRAVLAETLGVMVSMLPSAGDGSGPIMQLAQQMRTQVYDALLQSYLDSVNHPAENQSPSRHADNRRAAAHALLTDTRALTPQAIPGIVQNMSREMAQSLAQTELSPVTARAFLDALAQSGTRMQLGQLADPTAVAMAFGGLARYATPADVQALSSLVHSASLQRANLITAPLQGLLGGSPPGIASLGAALQQPTVNDRTAATDFERAVGTSLLSMMLGSQNAETRRDAMEHFNSHSWLPEMTGQMRQAVRGYLEHAQNYDLNALRDAFDLVPGHRVQPPLALSLHMLGVQGNDADLFRLASDMVARAGSEQAVRDQYMPLLVAARVLNEVDPSVRALMYPDGLPAPLTVSQVATRLAQTGQLAPGQTFLNNFFPRLNEVIRQQNQAYQTADSETRATLGRMHQAPLGVLSAIQQTQVANEQLRAHDRAVRMREMEMTRPAHPMAAPAVHFPDIGAAQNDAVSNYEREATAYRTQAASMAQLGQSLRHLGNATLLTSYYGANLNGHNDDAAASLLGLYRNNAAPASMNDDLTRVWAGLRRNGIAPLDSATLPSFDGTTQAGRDQILAGLTRLTRFNARTNPRLSDDVLDHLHHTAVDAVGSRMEAELMRDPRMQRFMTMSRQFLELSGDIPPFFQAVMAVGEGSREQRLTDAVSNFVTNLNNFLNNADNRATRGQIVELAREYRQRLATMPDGSGKERLQQMLGMMDQSLQLFDPNSSFRRDLTNIAQAVANGEHRDPNFWQRFRNASVHVVTTVAVAAAITAAAALTGPAAPFVMAAAIPLATWATSQATQEALHQAGWASRGSQIGDLIGSRHQYNPATGRFEFNARQTGLGVIEGIGMEYAMYFATLGLGRVGGAIGRTIVPGGRAVVLQGGVHALEGQLPRLLPTAAQTFRQTFAREFTQGLAIGVPLAGLHAGEPSLQYAGLLVPLLHGGWSGARRTGSLVHENPTVVAQAAANQRIPITVDPATGGLFVRSGHDWIPIVQRPTGTAGDVHPVPTLAGNQPGLRLQVHQLPAEFRLTHAPEALNRLGQAVSEVSGNWTNLNGQRAPVSEYLQAQRRLDRQLTMEAARSGSTLEALRTQLGQGHGPQELQNLHQQVQALANNPAVQQVQQRIAALQQQMNVAARQIGSGEVHLTVSDLAPGQNGLYRHGQNEVVLSLNDLLTPGNSQRLSQAIAHELGHRAQDIFIVRALAQELQSTNADVFSAAGRQRLMTAFHERTGFRLNDTFALEILNQHTTAAPLSSADVTRAGQLATSLRHYTSQALVVQDRLGIIEREISSLQNNGQQLSTFLRELTNNPERRRTLFGTDNLSWLADLNQRASNANVSSTQRQQLVNELVGHMQGRSNQLNQYVRQLYQQAMHENSLTFLGALQAPPMEAHGNGHPRPNEGSAMQAQPVNTDHLLTQAQSAGTIDAPTATALRQSLQNGRITSDGLQRYLSMSEDARIGLSRLMAHDNTELTPQQLRQLLMLEPPALDNLTSSANRWNQYVLRGLREGYFDSASLAAFANPSNRPAMESLLQSAFQNLANLSPEAFRNFAQLPGTHMQVLSQFTPANLRAFLAAPEAVSNFRQLTRGQAQLIARNSAADVTFLISRFQPANASDWGLVLHGGRVTRAQLQLIAALPAQIGDSIRLIATTTNAGSELIGRILSQSGSGQLSTQSLRLYADSLASQFRRTALSAENFAQVLNLPPAERQVADAMLLRSRQTPGVPNQAAPASMTMPEILHQLNQYRASVAAGLLSWPDVSTMITERGPHEIFLRQILAQQARAAQTERISAENFQRLTTMSRRGDITPEALEGYRRALANGALTDQQLGQILQQAPAVRNLYELVMRGTHDVETLRDHLRQSVARVQELASQIPAHQIQQLEAGLFPTAARFDLQQTSATQAVRNSAEINEFVEAMANRDFQAALRAASHNHQTVVDYWQPVRISYGDLENPVRLQEVLRQMDRVGDAGGAESAPGATTYTRATMPDVIVQLPNGTFLNLRTGSVGTIEGVERTDPVSGRSETTTEFQSSRSMTAEERDLMNRIRSSTAGQLLTARMALTAFEERLVHGFQGMSNRISTVTEQFMQSTQYQDLVRRLGANTPRLREALREIDVAATLYQFGFSATQVRALLGTRHLEDAAGNNIRLSFYEWLATVPARPARRPPVR